MFSLCRIMERKPGISVPL